MEVLEFLAAVSHVDKNAGYWIMAEKKELEDIGMIAVISDNLQFIKKLAEYLKMDYHQLEESTDYRIYFGTL